jgi:hypothetical protein
MTVSFVLELGFFLLLLLLPVILLLGEDTEAKRLLVGIAISFTLLVLVLIVITKPCETIGICP